MFLADFWNHGVISLIMRVFGVGITVVAVVVREYCTSFCWKIIDHIMGYETLGQGFVAAMSEKYQFAGET